MLQLIENPVCSSFPWNHRLMNSNMCHMTMHQITVLAGTRQLTNNSQEPSTEDDSKNKHLITASFMPI